MRGRRGERKTIREIYLLFSVPLLEVFYGQRNYENLGKMWEKDGNWVLNFGFLTCLVTKKAKEKKRKLSNMKIKLILNILFLN